MKERLEHMENKLGTSNIHLTVVQKIIFKYVIDGNFPELLNNTNLLIQRDQQISMRTHLKQNLNILSLSY